MSRPMTARLVARALQHRCPKCRVDDGVPCVDLRCVDPTAVAEPHPERVRASRAAS